MTRSKKRESTLSARQVELLLKQCKKALEEVKEAEMTLLILCDELGRHIPHE